MHFHASALELSHRIYQQEPLALARYVAEALVGEASFVGGLGRAARSRRLTVLVVSLLSEPLAKLPKTASPVPSPPQHMPLVLQLMEP